MKLIMLFCLEEDGPAVTTLLSRVGVDAYTRVEAEGRGGPGRGGWLEGIARRPSRIIFAVLPDEKARAVQAAVEEAESSNPDHPIRAALVDLETWVRSQG